MANLSCAFVPDSLNELFVACTLTPGNNVETLFSGHSVVSGPVISTGLSMMTCRPARVENPSSFPF